MTPICSKNDLFTAACNGLMRSIRAESANVHRVQVIERLKRCLCAIEADNLPKAKIDLEGSHYLVPEIEKHFVITYWSERDSGTWPHTSPALALLSLIIAQSDLGSGNQRELAGKAIQPIIEEFEGHAFA